MEIWRFGEEGPNRKEIVNENYRIYIATRSKAASCAFQNKELLGMYYSSLPFEDGRYHVHYLRWDPSDRTKQEADPSGERVTCSGAKHYGILLTSVKNKSIRYILHATFLRPNTTYTRIAGPGEERIITSATKQVDKGAILIDSVEEADPHGSARVSTSCTLETEITRSSLVAWLDEHTKRRSWWRSERIVDIQCCLEAAFKFVGDFVHFNRRVLHRYNYNYNAMYKAHWPEKSVKDICAEPPDNEERRPKSLRCVINRLNDIRLTGLARFRRASRSPHRTKDD